MWQRACPLLTAGLAVGLVLATRRLSDAKAELERLRTEAATARPAGAQPAATAPAASHGGAHEPQSERPAEVASDAPDISSEWEQAVPPMDS